MSEEIALSNLLSGRLSAGVIVTRGITPRPGPSLRERIAAETEALGAAHTDAPAPGFELTRRLYRSFGVDPTKHRPSSEALWRRLRGRGDFPAVNPAVDLTNLLSLRYQVCYGLYDLDRLSPPLAIDLGREGDAYQGIRKDVLNMAGRIVVRDRGGAFGNPSADSLRASVSASSRDILQVLFFHPQDPRQREIVSASESSFDEFFIVAERRSFIA
jgi:DNA/RNA-binding domain of Phe-tRNA-synthetase-like protein